MYILANHFGKKFWQIYICCCCFNLHFFHHKWGWTYWIPLHWVMRAPLPWQGCYTWRGTHLICSLLFLFSLLFIYSFTSGWVGSPLLSAGFLQLPYSRSHSLVGVCGLLTAGASLVEHGLWAQGPAVVVACGLGSWGSWARAQAPWLQHMGLVAQQHVGSSQVKDWTHVSCIGRQILYHWATREGLFLFFK